MSPHSFTRFTLMLAMAPRLAWAQGAPQTVPPSSAEQTASQAPPAAPPPETLPYEPGKPIPSGYHVEPNRAGPILTICGGVSFAVFGSLAVLGLSQRNDPEDLGKAIGTFGLLGMALSAPVFIVGMTLPRRVLQRDQSASLELHVTPQVARGGSGISVGGSF